MQCRAGLCFGPNVQFLAFMLPKHLWNLWTHAAGCVCLKLSNGPIQSFSSASVVFTHTCRTDLLTDDGKYTFNSSSAGFREVRPRWPCWLSLVLWIWPACRMVLLSPKAHHMAESDLDYQTASSEVYRQDSSLIAVFELSFA